MSQKLLSICIPTYNRADCLTRLLNNIISQALQFRDNVEICISSNGSTDNTKEVVAIFKEEYPDLIKYGENEKNLRFDRNVLKVVSMAEGEFVWTCSDDDVLVEGGFEKVIRFLRENRNKKMGGMIIKFSSYMVDARTGKRIKYQSSVDKNKPEMYGELSFAEILQDDVPYQGLSVLIFNNSLLKKILREKQDLVKKGIGTKQFHSWLFFLLFLLNREAKCYVLNKAIMASTSKTRYMMEDYVDLIYTWKVKLFDDLLLIVNKSEKDVIRAIKRLRRHPILSIMYIMALYKAFGMVNSTSCIKCLKFSFKHLSFIKALLISIFLVVILIIPSSIIKKMCKLSLRLRFKSKEKRESIWLETCTALYLNREDRSIAG